MISAPISRVEAPQDVCQAYCWAPSASENWMPKARAKFCPSSWLVPICSALPSPIIPSQVQVRTAPANRSRSVLWPVSTGIGGDVGHRRS